MALTLAYRGLDQVKGPYQGNPAATPYHLFRATLNISGTYATGGPQFDLCTLFAPNQTTGNAPAGSRMGVTAISVNWVKAFGDYYDGTTFVTPSDANVTLTSGGTATSISAASTNNLYQVKLFTGSGAVNGQNGSGAEVTNATALSGDFGIVFAAQLTFGSLGTV